MLKSMLIASAFERSLESFGGSKLYMTRYGRNRRVLVASLLGKRHIKNIHSLRSAEKQKVYLQRVNEMDNEDFIKHFRISRASFNMLLNCIKWSKFVGRQRLRKDLSLLLTLEWLANGCLTYRQLAHISGCSMAPVYRSIRGMLYRICLLLPQFICWPTGEEMDQNIRHFNSLRGPSSFPHVVGCIDGTHIPIKGPRTDNSYLNRHHFHSVILQAVCDSNGKFIDVYAGWPGSSHDNRVWKSSPLYQRLSTSTRNMIPMGHHLLGDSAYELNEWLMKPFTDNGHLSSAQKNFNYKLSSTRVLIECSFGILKSKFRRLKSTLDSGDIVLIKNAILASCILHNICINDGLISVSVEDYQPEENNPEPTLDVSDGSAAIKRNVIMSYFNSN